MKAKRNTMRIYITHCSAKKDNSLQDSGNEVPPDNLYTPKRIQRFMNRCKNQEVNWAIFSDLYGIWFPDEKHTWYDKHPDTIVKGKKVRDPEKFRELVSNFDQKLQNYNDIWFYYHPRRFHPFYKKLLQETSLKDKVKLFTHIGEVN
jgi:hypothetical protein